MAILNINGLWWALAIETKHLKNTHTWTFRYALFNDISKIQYINFDDDTNIEIIKITQIPQLFYILAHVDDEVYLLIKRGGDNILLNKITP